MLDLALFFFFVLITSSYLDTLIFIHIDVYGGKRNDLDDESYF
jgi:hypothetical protein